MLSYGTNTYLYGVTHIAQQNGTNTEYYLGDGLNSVRQLTNSTGDVSLARAYDPYGSTILNVGSAQTAYGYTGEYTDSTGQIYLRARNYAPGMGRFVSKDIWGGNSNYPSTFNPWVYGLNNPIIITDPSGNICVLGFNVAPTNINPCTPEQLEERYQYQEAMGETLAGVIDRSEITGNNPATELLVELLLIMAHDTWDSNFVKVPMDCANTSFYPDENCTPLDRLRCAIDMTLSTAVPIEIALLEPWMFLEGIPSSTTYAYVSETMTLDRLYMESRPGSRNWIREVPGGDAE